MAIRVGRGVGIGHLVALETLLLSLLVAQLVSRRIITAHAG